MKATTLFLLATAWSLASFTTPPKFSAPIKRGDHVKLTAHYGMRMHPLTKTKKMHTGVDFAAPLGTNILASAAGKVVKLGNEPRGKGYYLVLEHADGFKTTYAHLQKKISVKSGDQVKQGQIIATVGNSGLSTGPHLHYEMEKDGKKVDPMQYFTF